MKLRRISIAGFRGLSDQELDFTGHANRPKDVVVVVGPGKTSFLDAIVAAKEDIGPYTGVRDRASLVRSGCACARVSPTWVLSPHERKRQRCDEVEFATESVFGEQAQRGASRPEPLVKALAHYDPTEPGKVEYFHAERVLERDCSAAPETADRAMNRRLRLTTRSDKYRGVRAYLVKRVLADQVALATTLRERGVAIAEVQPDFKADFNRALAPLVPAKRFDGVDQVGGGYRVRFVGRDGGLSDLDSLSSSERQGVLFAATFAQAGLSSSLILIDGPELWIPPSRQAAFFAGIVALGSGNQIIATTESQEIIASLDPSAVVRLSSQ